jgi:hypothetical protein
MVVVAEDALMLEVMLITDAQEAQVVVQVMIMAV